MGKQDVATWLYLISGAPGRTVGLLNEPPKNGKNKKRKKKSSGETEKKKILFFFIW